MFPQTLDGRQVAHHHAVVHEHREPDCPNAVALDQNALVKDGGDHAEPLEHLDEVLVPRLWRRAQAVEMAAKTVDLAEHPDVEFAGVRDGRVEKGVGDVGGVDLGASGKRVDDESEEDGGPRSGRGHFLSCERSFVAIAQDDEAGFEANAVLFVWSFGHEHEHGGDHLCAARQAARVCLLNDTVLLDACHLAAGRELPQALLFFR
mmetsp:Transcript_4167/g.10547  ORF Transcript_4167/g.10547 Transcript_4167/m.10547 type:complete len:205 (+) Transcript_4167:138-752(+)